MISLLQSIVDVFVSIIQFVTNTVMSLMNLLVHIPTYTSFLITSIGYLPTMILPFAIASVSVYVIFVVLNRG